MIFGWIISLCFFRLSFGRYGRDDNEKNCNCDFSLALSHFRLCARRKTVATYWLWISLHRSIAQLKILHLFLSYFLLLLLCVCLFFRFCNANSHSSSSSQHFWTCHDRDYVNQFDLFENNKHCRYENCTIWIYGLAYVCVCIGNHSNRQTVKTKLISHTKYRNSRLATFKSNCVYAVYVEEEKNHGKSYINVCLCVHLYVFSFSYSLIYVPVKHGAAEEREKEEKKLLGATVNILLLIPLFIHS